MKNERPYEGEYFVWKCSACGACESRPLSKEYLRGLKQGKMEFGQFECHSDTCKGTMQKHQKLEKLFTLNRTPKRTAYRPFENLKLK